jgi:hypothetical protein
MRNGLGKSQVLLRGRIDGPTIAGDQSLGTAGSSRLTNDVIHRTDERRSDVLFP